MIKGLLKLLLGAFMVLLGIMSIISDGGVFGWLLVAMGLLVAAVA